jgi:hypothetical protein|tara:strand:- start:4323 stop:4493 length:171 start_codon:yes stop_codon:yes gene_type:complete
MRRRQQGGVVITRRCRNAERWGDALRLNNTMRDIVMMVQRRRQQQQGLQGDARRCK